MTTVKTETRTVVLQGLWNPKLEKRQYRYQVSENGQLVATSDYLYNTDEEALATALAYEAPEPVDLLSLQDLSKVYG